MSIDSGGYSGTFERRDHVSVPYREVVLISEGRFTHILVAFCTEAVLGGSIIL